LGDSSYERFAYAGKLLHRRLVALGAEPILEATYGDERAPDGMEQAFVPWLESLMEGVIPHLLPVPRHVDTERTDLAEPIYRISFLDDEAVPNQLERLSLDEEGRPKRNGGPNGDAEGVQGSIAPVRVEDAIHGQAHEMLKPDDWVWATLKRKERVTTQGWWQDVRQLELELEDSTAYVHLHATCKASMLT
jgi:sulfite reductase alpha subunit-like flavoprotein